MPERPELLLPENLDQVPVQAPGFRVWINRPRVAEKGMKLLDSAPRRDEAHDPSYTHETTR